MTNLTNWWSELTLSVHIMVVRGETEEADLMMGLKIVFLLTKTFFSYLFLTNLVIYSYCFIKKALNTVKVNILYC